MWRLLGANNRELGRGVGQLETVEECEQVIESLRRYPADRLDARISFDPHARGWSWLVALGPIEVARSARSFSRQRECLNSLDQFRARIGDAPPPS